MPITSKSFVRSTILLLLAGLAALMAIVATSLWLADRTQDYVGEVVTAREVRSAVVDLLVLLQDAETGQRGYLLTSEDHYLAPYNAAIVAVRPGLEKLRRLASGYPEMTAPVAELSRLVDTKLAELARTVALQQGGQRQEALALVDSDVGQRAMVRARAIFNSVLTEADRRLNDRIAAQQSSIASLRWVTLVGALAILIVVGGSALTVLRYTRDLATARTEVELANASLEERVRDRTAELGRANDEIQRFAYIVTHDLRAPLVNIMGFTSELEASLAPIQALVLRAEEQGDDQAVQEAKAAAVEDLPEAINFIRSSTRKMDGLINAILKLSRDGRRALKPEPIELEALLRASASAIQHQVGESDGEIAFDIRTSKLVSDRMSLEQVFGNLLDNAVKYRNAERPLRLKVRAVAAPIDRILIEIEDNGRGIAAQDHDRVFELFRRSGAQDQAGDGIGLAHVRSVIRNLGGEISLKSEFGRGSTFIVSLPRDIASVIRSTAA